MPATESLLTTSADELFELVKKKGKISVEELAKMLRMPQKTVQGLVDFLVEEKILGLEYKFTVPYVYISKEEIKKPSIAGKQAPEKRLVTKEDFYEKAKQKNIPHDKIEELWKKYLNNNLDYIKTEFYQKAKSMNIPEGKIAELWKKYLSHLT